MRSKIYFVTFMGMVALYMLRAGYVWSKPYFAKKYQLTYLFLSFVDACQFIGLGVAFTLRYYIFNQIYTIKQFTLAGLIMVALYSLIPLVPMLSDLISHQFIAILPVVSFSFGFLQFTFQPALLSEVHRYYS